MEAMIAKRPAGRLALAAALLGMTLAGCRGKTDPDFLGSAVVEAGSSTKARANSRRRCSNSNPTASIISARCPKVVQVPMKTAWLKNLPDRCSLAISHMRTATTILWS